MSGIHRSIRRLVVVVTAASLAGALPAIPASAKPTPGPPQAVFDRWTDQADFAAGQGEGVVASATALEFEHAIGQLRYDDPFGHPSRDWDYARWTSPVQPVGFDATELVASWTANAPAGTWLQVEMRATAAGTQSKWYILGRWAGDDEYLHRTSVPSQGDSDGFVAVDTFVAADDRQFSHYQLRVTLYRLAGTTRQIALRTLGAMASNVPANRKIDQASPLGGAQGIELAVPRYSQEIHVGEYPQWDGGGEAWCSPTSTSMVLAYWNSGPTPEDYAWVNPAFADPWVDHAARGTYDYAYEGAGNWPFNPAYAGQYGTDGFVTRLRSLTEVEQFIKAGIPLITSQSFKANELPGAGYSTSGHLMVIIGFTGSGDVIANDPAAPNNAAVRHVYPRLNFERVWQQSSGGIVYVIAPPGHALPPHVAGVDQNW